MQVVAAIDASPIGRRVADRTRLIAEDLGADISLLHVLEPMPTLGVDKSFETVVRHHQEREAAALAEWLRSRTSRAVDLEVPRGTASGTIARRSRQARLVTVGTSSVDPERVGPMTRRLARKLLCDVVMVRRAPRRKYRTVVAAVDLSEASRTAVDLALDIAPDAEVLVTVCVPMVIEASLRDSGLFEEELVVVHEGRRKAAGDALDSFIEPWGERVKGLLVEGPVAETLGETARRRNADLVTVGSRGAGKNAMVLLGSVAESVMETSPCDVGIARVAGAFRRP